MFRLLARARWGLSLICIPGFDRDNVNDEKTEEQPASRASEDQVPFPFSLWDLDCNQLIFHWARLGLRSFVLARLALYNAYIIPLLSAANLQIYAAIGVMSYHFEAMSSVRT